MISSGNKSDEREDREQWQKKLDLSLIFINWKRIKELRINNIKGHGSVGLSLLVSRQINTQIMEK